MTHCKVLPNGTGTVSCPEPSGRTGNTGLSTLKKLACMLLLFTAVHVQLTAQRITLSYTNAPLDKVLTELHKQSGFNFLYSADIMKQSKPVTIEVQNAPLSEVLEKSFAAQPFTYEITDKTILIKLRRAAPQSARPAQPKTDIIIKGKVLDENGKPMAGAQVSVKTNPGVSVITDEQGNYTITVPQASSVLQFAFVGYTPLEKEAGNSTQVAMKPQARELDEVVVAYGTSRKRDLTNAVAQVTSADFDKRPVTNINSVLAGAAPGIQTNAGSGQPGEGPDVRIRGFGSIINGNSPLYVLDGAPYEGVLSNLNPDDIASISILKDASATAIYGARGANGVILINTKTGKRNKNNIGVKVLQGTSSRALPNYNKVDAYQYYPLMWETLRNSLISATVTEAQANVLASQGIVAELGINPFNVPNDQVVLTDGTINPQAKLKFDDLNWRKALERTASRGEYNVTLSGGSAKSDYFVSLGYLNDKGYSIKSDFERYSARLRVNAQPMKWLKAGANMAFNSTTSNQANEGSGINENPFYIDLILGPVYPVYRHDSTGAYRLDANGNKQYDAGDYRPLFTGRNVLAETVLNDVVQKRNAVTGNGNVEVNFLKHFRLGTNVSINFNNYKSISYDNATVGDAIGAGRTYRLNTASTYYNVNQLLNYDQKFGRHSVKGLLGHENYNNSYDYFAGNARGQIVEGTTVLDNFTTVTLLSSYDRDYRTEGFFGRLEYGFDNRYVLSGSFRRDGSSKFHPDHKWGNFGSVSGAWNIDREKFFKSKQVDYLKLRASYGSVGNDNLSGYFLYQALYTLGYNNGADPGMLQSSVRSDNLVWESSTSTDVAVDFGMFRNRLSGTVEVFRRQSSNLLFDEPLPLTSGLLTRNVNLGSMRNEGVEIQLSGDIVRHRNFTWNMVLNTTTFRNKVLVLPPGYAGRINGTKKYEVGRSMYEFWLRDWYGVDPETGSDLYWASNTTATTAFVTKGGDTVTTSATNARYSYTGSAIPDWYGSINNTFAYKNFSLQFLIMYQLGGKVIDNDYQSLMYRGSYGRALHTDALKRWQKPGDITDVPKRGTGYTMYDSDRFLVDATYFNLRSISLTYNLPRTFISRMGMESARAYISGENVWITSKRKGLDPTQTYTGAPSYTYAPSRAITLGINVNF